MKALEEERTGQQAVGIICDLAVANSLRFSQSFSGQYSVETDSGLLPHDNLLPEVSAGVFQALSNDMLAALTMITK